MNNLEKEDVLKIIKYLGDWSYEIWDRDKSKYDDPVDNKVSIKIDQRIRQLSGEYDLLKEAEEILNRDRSKDAYRRGYIAGLLAKGDLLPKEGEIEP